MSFNAPWKLKRPHKKMQRWSHFFSTNNWTWSTTRHERYSIVVYADDFVVTGKSQETLERRIKPIISEFLSERGLRLSEKKTLISHVDGGFDFLGFNVRKYNGVLIIKPSKKSIKAFLAKIRVTIKRYRTAKTENLIRTLNPMIRGWANYYRHACSQKAFSYVDLCIYHALWNWAKRRHPNRSRRWVWRKYFGDSATNKHTLTTRTGGKFISLFLAASLPIRRHLKIKMNAHPFDKAYADYFVLRERRRRAPAEEPEPIF